MNREKSRRSFLSVLGTASILTIAGCSSDSGPRPTDASRTPATDPTPSSTSGPGGGDTPAGSTESGGTGTATGTPSLESGTIPTTSLPDIAGIVPQVDPLIVSAWGSPAGGISVTSPGSFDEREDTLRYNAVTGRLAPTAMAAYLLSREEAPFVGPLWQSYLQAGVTVEWTAVVAGVSTMYSSDIGLSTARETLGGLAVEYETITDSDDAVILRGPDGDVVGVTSDVFAFVPAGEGSVPFSPVDRVTALVETASGKREPLPSRDSSLEATLQHARLEGIVHLAHSQEAPLGEVLSDRRSEDGGGPFAVTGYAAGYEAARTAVCQLDRTEDPPVPATATVGFADQRDIDGATLVANVGNLGSSRRYVRDGRIVRVGCEYGEDALSALLEDSSIGA